MGFGSPIHWIVLGILAILVLGGGRFSNMMGDVAKGIKQFKKGMSEEDETASASRIESKRVTDPTVDATVERVRDTER
jgi:sec-independent protein translocase protein TatA